MIVAKFQRLESGRAVINVSNIFGTRLEIFIASGQGKRAESYSSKALRAFPSAPHRRGSPGPGDIAKKIERNLLRNEKNHLAVQKVGSLALSRDGSPPSNTWVAGPYSTKSSLDSPQCADLKPCWREGPHPSLKTCGAEVSESS